MTDAGETGLFLLLLWTKSHNMLKVGQHINGRASGVKQFLGQKQEERLIKTTERPVNPAGVKT